MGGHQWRRGGARGAAEAQNKVPRSPDATQRRQFSPPITPSAHWTHPGASMRRYDSPIARRRARSRAAETDSEHPKMAARAASAAQQAGWLYPALAVLTAHEAGKLPGALSARGLPACFFVCVCWWRVEGFNFFLKRKGEKETRRRVGGRVSKRASAAARL